MANHVHGEYFIYGSSEQVGALYTEIAKAYESLGCTMESPVYAEDLLYLLGVKQPVDGTILSVSRRKSHTLEWGILIDTEMRWSHIQMNEAIEKLTNSRSGLKTAYRATDDFMDVHDPDRVFFKNPKTDEVTFKLRGEYGGRVVDETFSDEEDLLDFARNDLELGVRSIEELYMALDRSGVELIDSSSRTRNSGPELSGNTWKSDDGVPGRCLERYEAALVRLGELVAGIDNKPSTMATLRDCVYELDPDLAPALDDIPFWSKRYFGTTPARLLKSRGILPGGRAKKASTETKTNTSTKKEEPSDDSEIEKLLENLKARYSHKARPTTLSELVNNNPELRDHLKQVKYYIAQLGRGSAMKYFEEEGLISKCRMEGSIPRPTNDVIEQYHSAARMDKEGLLALAPDARFVEFDTVCMVYEDEGEPEAYEMLRVGDYLDVVVKWLPEVGREPDGLPYGRIHFHFCGHDLGIIKYQDQMDHLSIVGCAGKPEAYGAVGGRVFAQVIGLANGKKAPRVPVHVLYAVDKGWTGAAATVDSGASAGAASHYSYPTGSARPQPAIERRPIAALPDPSKLYASVSEHKFSYGGERGFEYTFWLPEGGEADDLAIANSYLRALEY